jgi:predicted mannosyl-3-phosphoglycerate phosphatase (HAD superfamily)
VALTLRIIATWGGDMTSAWKEAEKAFKKTEVNMESEISLEEMGKQIEELEAQLRDMKKAYRDKRFAGVKSAMEARKSADEALREELKALGVSAVSSSWSSLDPSRLYTKWY